MNVPLFREFVREITRLAGLLGNQKNVVRDLTMTQCHILIEIGQGAVRHRDLASALGVDPSTLSRTLELLVAKGLVQRERSSGSRRETLTSLTATGAEVLDEISVVMGRRFDQVLQYVPPEKLKDVEHSVTLLLHAIKQARAGEEAIKVAESST